MNKKFSKAAALSIAAVTAISAMALPVSADITNATSDPTSNRVQGTVIVLTTTTTTYKAEPIPNTAPAAYKWVVNGTPTSNINYYSTTAKAVEAGKKFVEANTYPNNGNIAQAPTTAAAVTEVRSYTYTASNLSNHVAQNGALDINADSGVVTFGSGSYIFSGSNGGGTGTGGGTTPSNPVNPGINTYYPTSESDRMTPGSLSYLGLNGRYYTTYSNALYYGGGVRGSINNNWSSYANTNDQVYFDASDGQYYLTSGTYRYVVRNATATYYSSSYGSYLSANGLYYPTIAAAQNASYIYNGSSTYSTKYTSASARYLSMKTGNFYSTYSAALSASSSSSYVIDLADYKGTSYNYYDPYYYYGYYYGGTTTTKVDPDAATIYGSSKKSGWTTIKSYITYASKNSTVKIDMKKQTSVPSSILAAAKKRGVNLQLILPNGVKWTIDYNDITDTNSALDITTKYNMKVVPSSLVKKAKKANKDVVSTAQIQVGGSSYLPASADVTVKLPAKRSGCTVKAYRYTSSGSLKLADTSKVTNTGAVTLDISDGGYYLLVVCD